MYSIEPKIAGKVIPGSHGTSSGQERRPPWTASSDRHDDTGAEGRGGLFRRLCQRERELDAARRVSEALFQHTRLDELVEQALKTALEVVGAEAGAVLLADPQSKQLVFHHSMGECPVPSGTQMPWDYGIAGAVFNSEKAEIVPDVKQDRRHFPGIDLQVGYTTHDMIILPLKRWKGAPIGVLTVLNKRNEMFNGEDLSILTILSALTATAIEQARLSEQAKLGEIVCLLGDIGHDIKNMLGPVLLGVGILKNGLDEICSNVPQQQMQASRDQCYQVIDVVRSSARHIQDRVHQIAECVKGRSSPIRFAPCQLSSVVPSVMTALRLAAEERHIVLRAAGLEDLPTILADEHRLYNAFYNVINNAIPEVEAGGSIEVRGRSDAAGVVLSVSDTGRGIPPEILNCLFTSHAMSRKPGGTGLGIKIIKDAVEAHGGAITVESTVGIGTTFQVRLPISPPIR